MKCYFDNRQFCETFVDIILDKQYIDTVYIKGYAISSITLPNDINQIEFSFHRCYKMSTNIKPVIESNVPYEFETDLIDDECKNIIPQFRFPYNLIINAESNNVDLILYPSIIEVDDIKNVLIYKVIDTLDFKSVDSMLIKKKVLDIKDYRKKEMLKGGIISLVALFCSVLSILTFISTVLSIRKHYALMGLTGSIVMFIIGIMYLWLNYKYENYYCEEALPQNVTKEFFDGK